MKITIQQGVSEKEYTQKDLDREAHNIARKAGGKVKDSLIVISDGAAYLKVVIRIKDGDYTHRVKL